VRLTLTLAIGEYDHVADLVNGRVSVNGVNLIPLQFSPEETFFRFTRFREWDVSELSLAKFCALRSSGDTSLVAIPVFPSRCFRHSAIFVRSDGPVDKPAALAHGRIGIPEWTQTATVYARGILQHQYGVSLSDIQWFQAGTNEPGRVEGVTHALPAELRLTRVHDRSLNEMLLAGDLDAVIAAHPPESFTGGRSVVVRLFSDYRQHELSYFRATGVFPIMHLVALRREIYEQHPWVAMNLYKAFSEAKARALIRALDTNAPKYPVPWGPAHGEEARELFGDDFWPYGVAANRRTLETFLGFAFEQGVCMQTLLPEELFVESVTEQFRI
jgi:4,5-dihydroxyphthalate decarboxylase